MSAREWVVPLRMIAPDEFSAIQEAQIRAIVETAIAAAGGIDGGARWLWEPLGRQEAADFLDMDPDELSRLASAGDVPVSYALGPRTPRFFRGELLDWMRANRERRAAE